MSVDMDDRRIHERKFLPRVQIVPQPLFVKKWDRSGTALLTNNSS